MRYWSLGFSFLIVALGQPAWISSFGILAGAFGYALFWQGMLNFPKTRDRFLISWGWYAAVQGVQFSWIASPEFMGPLIIPFYFFLILGMGLQFGALSLFIRYPLSWHKCFALAGAWVLCEWIRLYFLCGCTWNPAGLSLVCSSYSLQLASIWGIFGLSFWVILVNLAFLKKSFKIGAAMALFPYLFGLIQQTWVENTTSAHKTLKVALVQTNLAPHEKEFDSKMPTAYVHPIDQWEKILDELKEPVDLIVLPEAALPLGAHLAIYELSSIKNLFPDPVLPPLKSPYALFYRNSWKVSNAFIAQALANQTGADVIIGLDDRDFLGKYNAAFHFSPANAPIERYEKQILAPVGEYIPLAGIKWFAKFVGKQFGIYGSFDAGKEAKIFRSHVPLGISICLEETFSQLIRQLRLKGAELLVSISNDAYFPNTKLGQQHFDHGKVRAVENGAPLLRACNSGVTGAVDCFGRSLEILKTPTTKDVKALVLKVPIRSYKTLYTFWGDAAILALSALFVVSFLLSSEKKKLL